MELGINRSGTCNAICFWFDLWLDSETKLSNTPLVSQDNKTPPPSWMQAVQYVEEAAVTAGQVRPVTPCCSKERQGGGKNSHRTPNIGAFVVQDLGFTYFIDCLISPPPPPPPPPHRASRFLQSTIRTEFHSSGTPVIKALRGRTSRPSTLSGRPT